MNCVQWHPTDVNTFLSCGSDSSIRIWDVNGSKTFEQLICKTVIRAKDARGVARISVTDCSFNPDGTAIAATTIDGALHVWQNKRTYGRPDSYVKDAHSGEISSVSWSPSGTFIGTRGFDNTLKLWDVRNLKAPIKTFTNLPNYMSVTKATFSPDSSLILTGTNSLKGEASGKISLFDTVSGDVAPIKEIQLPSGGLSVGNLIWHKEVNQIFVGLSNGSIKVLYNPLLSKKGYLSTAGRVAKKREDGYAFISDDVMIQNPHSLKAFAQETLNKKRKRDILRADPIASNAPEAPLRGPGRGGRVGDKSTFTTHLMKTLAKDTARMLDPRDAILAYEGKDDSYVEVAYRNNKKILATKTLEQEEIENKQKYDARRR